MTQRAAGFIRFIPAVTYVSLFGCLARRGEPPLAGCGTKTRSLLLLEIRRLALGFPPLRLRNNEDLAGQLVALGVIAVRAGRAANDEAERLLLALDRDENIHRSVLEIQLVLRLVPALDAHEMVG